MKKKRTYADRSDYLIRAVSERRRRIRQMAVDHKGGKCQLCGYQRCQAALDFHHLDPNKKDFRISSGNTIAWRRVKEEIEKCVLICANCHREIHAGITQLPMATSDVK